VIGPGDGTPAVIVLAAGIGSRLGRLVVKRPKWLLDLAPDAPLARHHLRAIDRALAAGAPRIAVAGHASDALRVFLLREGAAHVDVVVNPRYATWNNWYSLLVGLRRLDELGWAGPVIVLNADLYCPEEWLADVAAGITHRPPPEVLLAIDVGRPLTDEAMKVELDGTGRVTAIGKFGLARPAGEYIGLAALSSAGRAAVAGILQTFAADGRTDEWYEAGLQQAMDSGLRVEAWTTPHSDWVEIDDADDHAAAQDLYERRRRGAEAGGCR